MFALQSNGGALLQFTSSGGGSTAVPLNDGGTPWGFDSALDSSNRALIAVYDLSGRDVVAAIPTGASTWAWGVEVDLTDRPHLVYRQYDRQLLRYAVRSAGARTTEDLDSRFAGSERAIATDSRGRPNVCFFGTGGVVRYAIKSNGAWSVQDVGMADTTGRRGCAIAMGPLDEPYIAIVDRTGVRLAR